MHPQRSARTQPSVSSLLCSESARTDGNANEVRRGGGRVEEGRSGQQTHERQRVRVVSLRLLSAAVLRVHEEPPSSSLLSSEGAGMVGDTNGGRGECEGSGGG